MMKKMTSTTAPRVQALGITEAGTYRIVGTTTKLTVTDGILTHPHGLFWATEGLAVDVLDALDGRRIVLPEEEKRDIGYLCEGGRYCVHGYDSTHWAYPSEEV